MSLITRAIGAIPYTNTPTTLSAAAPMVMASGQACATSARLRTTTAVDTSIRLGAEAPKTTDHANTCARQLPSTIPLHILRLAGARLVHRQAFGRRCAVACGRPATET